MLLSMTTLGTLSASAADWFAKAPAQNVAYSFALIGDIQTLTEKDVIDGSSYVSSIFSWLLTAKNSRKIEYVFGLGDTVETLSTWPEAQYNTSVQNPNEWKLASAQIHRLDGVIPYMVIRGNHDDEAGYHKYICTEAYKAQMDEFFYDPSKPALHGNSMSNSYQKIEIGGVKYLMMALDFDLNEDTVNWANEVISSNPDYKVIVSVHAYIKEHAVFIKEKVGQPGENNQMDGDRWHDWISFDGEAMWDSIFSKHPNMFMVFCGHVAVDSPVTHVRQGDNGNGVLHVLVDPQGNDKRTPAGMVLLMNFKENGEQIEFEYFSTVKRQYYKGYNQFTINTPECFTSEPVVEETETTVEEITTVPETEADITVADTAAAENNSCKGAISSTVTVTCIIGTTLSAFAMRKRKED